jgi:hypothetical protein
MDPVVYILIGVAVLVGWIVAGKRNNKLHQAQAKRLGLTIDNSLLGGAEMSGLYKGLPVRVSETHEKNGRHVTTYTCVEADITTRLPAGFKLVHENDVATLGKIFGLQDVVVGHPQLDRTCVIKAKDPEEACAFFERPGIADALASFFERYDDACLSAGTLEVHRRGPSESHAGLMLDAMARLNDVLTGNAEYRAPGAASAEAGMGDSQKVVEAELARRKTDADTP